MNKNRHLVTKKSSASLLDPTRPMLTLGTRRARRIITCRVCGQQKTAHRENANTCSNRCRVAWHRMTETEKEILTQGINILDHGTLIA